MRGTSRLALLASCLIIIPAATYGGEPTCRPYQSGPYCQYTGKIDRAYVNNNNLILLYFDTAMDPTAPENVGITGVTRFTAAAYPMNENIEFAKLLYSSLLTAQARDVTVTVQMRQLYSGYLKIDRIWVNN